MPKRKRHRVPSKADEEKKQLLAQLTELAGRVGVEVREEKLVREVGYSVRSGQCKLNGEPVVLLDTNTSLSDRIEVMLDFLSSQNIDDIYIEPEIRRLIAASLADDESSDSATSA